MDQIRREHLARVGAALCPPFRPGQVLLENDRKGMNVRDVKLAERRHHDIEPQRIDVGRDGSLGGVRRHRKWSGHWTRGRVMPRAGRTPAENANLRWLIRKRSVGAR